MVVQFGDGGEKKSTKALVNQLVGEVKEFVDDKRKELRQVGF